MGGYSKSLSKQLRQREAAQQALDNMLAVGTPSNDDDGLSITLVCLEGEGLTFSLGYYNRAQFLQAISRISRTGLDKYLTGLGVPHDDDDTRAAIAINNIRAVARGELERTDDELGVMILYVVSKIESPEQIREAVGYLLVLGNDGTYKYKRCKTLEEYKAECARLNLRPALEDEAA